MANNFRCRFRCYFGWHRKFSESPLKGFPVRCRKSPLGDTLSGAFSGASLGGKNQRMKTAMRGSTLPNDAERHIPGVKGAPPWPGDMVADLRSLAARIEEAEGLCDE